MEFRGFACRQEAAGQFEPAAFRLCPKERRIDRTLRGPVRVKMRSGPMMLECLLTPQNRTYYADTGMEMLPASIPISVPACAEDKPVWNPQKTWTDRVSCHFPSVDSLVPFPLRPRRRDAGR